MQRICSLVRLNTRGLRQRLRKDEIRKEVIEKYFNSLYDTENTHDISIKFKLGLRVASVSEFASDKDSSHKKIDFSLQKRGTRRI